MKKKITNYLALDWLHDVFRFFIVNALDTNLLQHFPPWVACAPQYWQLTYCRGSWLCFELADLLNGRKKKNHIRGSHNLEKKNGNIVEWECKKGKHNNSHLLRKLPCKNLKAFPSKSLFLKVQSSGTMALKSFSSHNSSSCSSTSHSTRQVLNELISFSDNCIDWLWNHESTPLHMNCDMLVLALFLFLSLFARAVFPRLERVKKIFFPHTIGASHCYIFAPFSRSGRRSRQ